MKVVVVHLWSDYCETLKWIRPGLGTKTDDLFLLKEYECKLPLNQDAVYFSKHCEQRVHRKEDNLMELNIFDFTPEHDILHFVYIQINQLKEYSVCLSVRK